MAQAVQDDGVLVSMSPNLIPEDRRLFSRFAWREPVNLRQGERNQTGTVLDISLNGALLEFSDGFTHDEQAQYKIEIPYAAGNATICADVDIVHVHGNRVGCRFLDVDSDNIAHLRALVLSLGTHGEI